MKRIFATQSANLTVQETNRDALRTVSDIPIGGFIPEHLSQWATISAFLPDVPAVELDLNQNGGLYGKVTIHQSVEIELTEKDEERYLPSALFIKQDGNSDVCVFDLSKHGWDAVECNYFPDSKTKSFDVECVKCGAEKFEPRISWLGYQVSDEGLPSATDSIKYRNSFDSISIDIKCLSCGTNENILNEETA